MGLDDEIKNMLDARAQLRSNAGISDPMFMSKWMDVLAQATGAVEEHLADLEKQYEEKRTKLYLSYVKTSSVTAAENNSKAETGSLSANIKRLTRLVGSSWKIVSEKQSRFNHLTSEWNINRKHQEG